MTLFLVIQGLTCDFLGGDFKAGFGGMNQMLMLPIL
ncbi:MAG: hypothetical protein CM15mP83_7740 [Flavobacteriaceae bacterium]|nr:MAG: hypothetical protein CM15mP83_7740 [Flavobacteriaceae bacterium]